MKLADVRKEFGVKMELWDTCVSIYEFCSSTTKRDNAYTAIYGEDVEHHADHETDQECIEAILKRLYPKRNFDVHYVEDGNIGSFEIFELIIIRRKYEQRRSEK